MNIWLTVHEREQERGVREGGREGGREGERERERERESYTSSDIKALKEGGRNFPLAAGKTPISCSSGLNGVSAPLGKELLTDEMSLKSEAKGA